MNDTENKVDPAVRCIRPAPCAACPYRRDVPSGVWAAHEYDKLRAYDNPTWAQPIAWFGCHASPEQYCNGWALVHDPHELLALRLEGAAGKWDGSVPAPSAAPLFGSGNEAADHGQLEIEAPSLESNKVVRRLFKKHPRLRAGNPELACEFLAGAMSSGGEVDG